ncbi:conserved uncharacterized protein [Desulfococcus multivorans]|nr:conserved uncharacterized protein [Desulfococcus multivorans]
MVRNRKKKCRHCGKLFLPDPRNVKHQKFCRDPECRKASKSASQRKWLQKPENLGYFRGPVNVRRVQEWRKDHPGYRRPKPKLAADALQDPLNAKHLENNEDTIHLTSNALQDLLIAQPTVLLGLIANFTGIALQDDIAVTVRRLRQLGQDILNSLPCKGGRHDNQIPHPARTAPQGAEAVQLARSPAGP